MHVVVSCFFRDAESLSGEIDLKRDNNNTAVHGWLSTDNSLYLINAQFLLVIQEVSGNDHHSAAIIHLGSFDCIESTASLVQAAVDLCIYTCRVVLLLSSSAKPTVLSIIYRFVRYFLHQLIQYIGWQWHNFVPFCMPAGFCRHLVGKTHRNVSTMLSLKYAL